MRSPVCRLQPTGQSPHWSVAVLSLPSEASARPRETRETRETCEKGMATIPTIPLPLGPAPY